MRYVNDEFMFSSCEQWEIAHPVDLIYCSRKLKSFYLQFKSFGMNSYYCGKNKSMKNFFESFIKIMQKKSFKFKF